VFISVCALRKLLHHLQEQTSLPAETAGAVLQLAMNCRNPSTAAAAAYSSRVLTASSARDVPASLQQAVARRLLLTAATRQHTDAVRILLVFPVMQQQLDAATLEVMLRQLLKYHECIRILCQLPVAAELSPDTAAGLLLAAYQGLMYDAGRELCALDASHQLSSEQIEALLQALLTQSTGYDSTSSWVFRQAFFGLPGVRQLSSSAVVRLLRTAISKIGVDFSEDLCEVPAAANISSADVVSLLHEAFAKPADMDIDFIVQDIKGLLAFKTLDSAEVAQLLHAAAKYYSADDELYELKG
jgi:hypothetical protein